MCCVYADAFLPPLPEGEGMKFLPPIVKGGGREDFLPPFVREMARM